MKRTDDLWPKFDYKEWRSQNPEKFLLNSARSRAKQRGVPFSITVVDIEIPEFCPYLKVRLEPNTMYAPSIDRITPSLGYVPGNVEVISRKANMMKSDASVEELLEFAYTILERH